MYSLSVSLDVVGGVAPRLLQLAVNDNLLVVVVDVLSHVGHAVKHLK